MICPMQLHCIFRECLRKANVIDEFFELFESYLRDRGLEVRGGHLIDDTIVPVSSVVAEKSTRKSGRSSAICMQ